MTQSYLIIKRLGSDKAVSCIQKQDVTQCELRSNEPKGASTSSNIAGNCVADPSTLSKFPATRLKIAGKTSFHI